ncbi:DUF1080 domain-containing protein [Puia sp.]|jgi:hypothetical protein|uniref:3-keto-disaccharide hydrolase n=1 Tax=Puia sp. TaxID=2045100 RepID=UPI002F3F6E74
MIKTITLLLFAACMIPSCTGGGKHDNELTAEEKKAGWVLLFDGSSMKGWHLYNNYKTSTWSVKDGELICGPDKRLEHGDLVTDKEYTNYDLRFDWKINKEGNSGVFIDVQERPDIPATYASGPEYQMLEVSHVDYADPLKRTGCLFNLTKQISPVSPTRAGEWNESRIRQQNGRVEFYVDGVLTTQVDLRSHEWIDSIGKSGFSKYPEFGRHVSGHIALQDWFKAVAFKNIRIREL